MTDADDVKDTLRVINAAQEKKDARRRERELHAADPEPEPLDDGPDGAALLDDLRATITNYVAFGDVHAPAAVALWIATTHALPAFECAPRLVITSPQKRCAKSRLLDIVAGTCHKPLATSNATTAAIFRSIGDDHPPTLILDEADTLWGSKKLAEQNEDLRALLNAGHQRGRPALRCVGPQQIPTEFATFCMAALAGIGDMPDTITDRAVNITMRRRAPGETVAQFRARRDGPILGTLWERLAEWASWWREALSDAAPDMPVEDRAADTWEPLIAVADAAGSHWPKTARAACAALVTAAEDADDDRTLGTKLLSDIRDTFEAVGVSFLPTAQLITELRRIEDSPWGEFELTPSKLAYRLREFNIKPTRAERNTIRGYRLEDFSDAFRRYTRPHPSSRPQTGADQAQRVDGSKREDDSTRPHENTRPQETPGQMAFVDVRTGVDGCSAGNVPESADLLGDPAQLATADTTADLGGCAVALESEGENDQHNRAVQTATAVLNGHIIGDQPSKPRGRRRG